VSQHVVVVGAGVIGLCTADALIDRGYRVTVLERDREPGNGCSYGNGGIVVPSHFVPLAAPGMVRQGLLMLRDRQSPFGVSKLTDLATLGWMARFARASNPGHVERSAPLLKELNLQSRTLYEGLVANLGVDVGYAKRGLLMLSRTHAAHEAESRLADQANRIGLRATLLTNDDLKRLEPDVEMDVAGAVHFEDDAHLTPPVFMEAMRRKLLACGAEIRYGISASGFRTENRTVKSIETDQGPLEADEFVVAAGAWSNALARSLGLKLPLLAGKGFGMTITDPPETPRIPAILTEARIAVTPMVDGVRFVGAMELGQPGVAPSAGRVEGMRRRIPEYYPSFTGDRLGAPVWSGNRPCSPDGLPYLGRTRRADNVVIATGHAMMGMSLGPVTGLVVSKIIAGDPPGIAIHLLDPDRYD
jgi:D-amino-acid dehydrogenase